MSKILLDLPIGFIILECSSIKFVNEGYLCWVLITKSLQFKNDEEINAFINKLQKNDICITKLHIQTDISPNVIDFLNRCNIKLDEIFIKVIDDNIPLMEFCVKNMKYLRSLDVTNTNSTTSESIKHYIYQFLNVLNDQNFNYLRSIALTHIEIGKWDNHMNLLVKIMKKHSNLVTIHFVGGQLSPEMFVTCINTFFDCKSKTRHYLQIHLINEDNLNPFTIGYALSKCMNYNGSFAFIQSSKVDNPINTLYDLMTKGLNDVKSYNMSMGLNSIENYNISLTSFCIFYYCSNILKLNLKNILNDYNIQKVYNNWEKVLHKLITTNKTENLLKITKNVKQMSSFMVLLEGIEIKRINRSCSFKKLPIDIMRRLKENYFLFTN